MAQASFWFRVLLQEIQDRAAAKVHCSVQDFMGMDYWRDDARIASHIADRVSADRM